jgi:NitT/TauT family transport system substrate-binding protein
MIHAVNIEILCSLPSLCFSEDLKYRKTKPRRVMKFQGRFLIAALLSLIAPRAPYAAEVGGKPEKVDVIVTYAQPSGAFTPIWVAHEAGLFKKYGLNATLQLLTPQVSAQAVVSEEADFYTDGPDLINARLRGGSVKYFGGTMQQLVFQIWAAKELRSMRDLKGKTVAASTPRAALDTATREALKKKWPRESRRAPRSGQRTIRLCG